MRVNPLHWRNQPAQVPELDRGGLGRGVVFHMPLSQAAGLREIVSGAVGTATTLGGRIPAKDGATYPLFTSSKISFPTAGLSSIGGSTPITIAWTQEPRNTAGYNAVFEWRPAGATNPFLIYQSSVEAAYNFVVGARLADGGGVVSTFSSAVGPATNGVLDRYVLTLPSGPSNGSTARLWRNGVEQIKGTSNASNQFGTATTAASSIGQLDGGGDPFEGLLGDFTIWNRVVADTEAIRWARNPWSLFAPVPRRLWIPVVGSATHTTTGALALDAAIIAGTATHLTLHATSGALASAAAAIAGAATHSALHSTSGALAAAAAAIAGTATHLTLHTASGALAADTAVIAGSADHTTPGGTTHTTTGALAADAAVIAGTAAHLTLHTTSGALSAGVAAIAGTSAHLTLHTTSGALQADSANISGVAQNGLFVPSTNRGAGSPSKTRKPRKRRFTVTVDGEDFQVSSVEEAQEILAKVRESAEEQAEVVTQRAKAVSNRPQRKVLADARKSLAVPSIKVPADMRPAAEALRAEIESIYNAAIQAVEIGALLRKQAEQDDEDDLLMLLA